MVEMSVSENDAIDHCVFFFHESDYFVRICAGIDYCRPSAIGFVLAY